MPSAKKSLLFLSPSPSSLSDSDVMVVSLRKNDLKKLRATCKLMNHAVEPLVFSSVPGPMGYCSYGDIARIKPGYPRNSILSRVMFSGMFRSSYFSVHIILLDCGTDVVTFLFRSTCD